MKIVKPGWISHGSDQPIFSLSVDPSGKRLATGSSDFKIKVWDTHAVADEKHEQNSGSSKLLAVMGNHTGTVNCVRWSPDGRYLASCSDDKTVIIWEKRMYQYESNLLQEPSTESNEDRSAQRPLSESYLAVRTLRQHTADVVDLAWKPTVLGERSEYVLASCGLDNTIFVWDISDFTVAAKLTDHQGPVKGLVWDPIGKYLASQSEDRSVIIWSVPNAAMIQTTSGTGYAVVKRITKPFLRSGPTTFFLRLSWSPDGKYLSTAHSYRNDHIVSALIERETWDCNINFVGHVAPVVSISWNPCFFLYGQENGRDEAPHSFLALGSQDNSVSIWITRDQPRPIVVCADLFLEGVLDMSWAPDGRTLYISSKDGRIASFELSVDEIGRTLNPVQVSMILKDLYGDFIGQRKVVLPESQRLLSYQRQQQQAQQQQQSATNISTVTTSTPAAVTAAVTAADRMSSPSKQQIETITANKRRRVQPVLVDAAPEQPQQSVSAPAPEPVEQPRGFELDSQQQDQPLLETNLALLAQCTQLVDPPLQAKTTPPQPTQSSARRKVAPTVPPQAATKTPVLGPGMGGYAFSSMIAKCPEEIVHRISTGGVLRVSNCNGALDRLSKLLLQDHENLLWQSLSPHSVYKVASSATTLALACAENIVLVYSVDAGSQLLPPMVLSAPAKVMRVASLQETISISPSEFFNRGVHDGTTYLGIVTESLECHVWDVAKQSTTVSRINTAGIIGPLLAKKSGLNSHDPDFELDLEVRLELTDAGMPVLLTRLGAAYMYHDGLETWVQIQSESMLLEIQAGVLMSTDVSVLQRRMMGQASSRSFLELLREKARQFSASLPSAISAYQQLSRYASAAVDYSLARQAYLESEFLLLYFFVQDNHDLLSNIARNYVAYLSQSNKAKQIKDLVLKLIRKVEQTAADHPMADPDKTLVKLLESLCLTLAGSKFTEVQNLVHFIDIEVQRIDS